MKKDFTIRTLKRTLSILTVFCLLLLPGTMRAFAQNSQPVPLTPGTAQNAVLRADTVSYAFAPAATGAYRLDVSDILLKEECGFTLKVFPEKGAATAQRNFDAVKEYDSFDAYGSADSSLCFVAKQGAKINIKLIPHVSSDLVSGVVAACSVKLTELPPAALTQGEPAAVTVTEEAPVVAYVFTPAQDGYYSFTSSVSDDDVDPCAALYDGNGKRLAENDDAFVKLLRPDNLGMPEIFEEIGLDTLNFNISQCLKAGQTYYLLARELSGKPCEYEVTAAPSKLAFAQDRMDIPYHRYAWFTDLIESCTYDALIVSADFELGLLGGAVEAEKRGTQEILFSSPDGKYSQCVTFQVDYSFVQWFAMVFLGGWLWLPQTPMLAPGQTLLEYWQEEITWKLDLMRWNAQERMDNLYWQLMYAW